MPISEIDWFGLVLAPILITILIGGPLSIWTAYMVTRRIEFRQVMRDIGHEIATAATTATDENSAASSVMIRQARVATHYYAILYDGGQQAAATEVANTISALEKGIEIFAEKSTCYRRHQCTLEELQAALESLKRVMRDASGRLARLQPELRGVLFGRLFIEFADKRAAGSRSDCDGKCSLCNRVV